MNKKQPIIKNTVRCMIIFRVTDRGKSDNYVQVIVGRGKSPLPLASQQQLLFAWQEGRRRD